MINNIKRTTSKAKPPAKPPPQLPQLPPKPIIVPPLLIRGEKWGHLHVF